MEHVTSICDRFFTIVCTCVTDFKEIERKGEERQFLEKFSHNDKKKLSFADIDFL